MGTVKAVPLLVFALCLSAQSLFDTLSARASTARDAHHLDEAATLYRKALALQPSWAEGWFFLGTINYDQNNFREASSAFTHVTTLAPKQGTAQIMLGLCEFELGHDDPALRHIQLGKHLGVSDDSPLRDVALFHEAVLLQRAGKFNPAQSILYSLAGGGAETKALVETLGMVALRLHDKTPPESMPLAQLGHAELLAAQNKFEDAGREYTAVVRAFPDIRNIHLAYGRFLLKSRDPSAAIPEFEQEIKNQPGAVVARLEIAAVKYRVDSAAGLPYAQDAVKLDPSSPFTHYLLGLLLLDTGDYQRAIPELETARTTLSEEGGIYYALGSAYTQAGRPQDAARARSTFQRLQHDSSSNH